MYQHLGAVVPLWVTHNEPWVASFLGYGNGYHAPGIADFKAGVRASHHLLLSHGLAVQAFRQVAPSDPDRIAFIHGDLLAAQRALAAGIDLRGYYVWSIIDNFEWAFGYAKRFGLVRVDYAIQRRIPKQSAHWYRGVIARNGP